MRSIFRDSVRSATSSKGAPMRFPNRPQILAAALLLLGAASARGAGEEPEYFSQPMMEQSIRAAVERSPKNYVAAVVTQSGLTVCVPEGGKDVCRAPVQTLEVLASVRPKQTPVFDLLTSTAGKEDGTKMLILATPMPGKEGLYGASYLSLDPSPEEIDQFRRALAAVIPARPSPAP